MSMESETATVTARGDACEGVPVSNGVVRHAQGGDDVDPRNSAVRLDVSPSLLRGGGGAPSAFEWKFLVNESLAIRIEDALRDAMILDPHGDDRFAGAYTVTTIYFDTPNWDVLQGIGRHKLRKYRLRRYGGTSDFFLERKTKRGKKVRKRRDAVAEDRLASAMGVQIDANPGESDGWFGRQVARQQLRPTCRIQYLRRAYYGSSLEGRLRLTFDRELRGAPVDGWPMRVTQDEVPIMTDRVICEFKFAGAMPSLFKKVIQDLQLQTTGYSKYRNGMKVFGVGPVTPPKSIQSDERSGAGDA